MIYDAKGPPKSLFDAIKRGTEGPAAFDKDVAENVQKEVVSYLKVKFVEEEIHVDANTADLLEGLLIRIVGDE